MSETPDQKPANMNPFSFILNNKNNIEYGGIREDWEAREAYSQRQMQAQNNQRSLSAVKPN
jgi:hypothetical protein